MYKLEVNDILRAKAFTKITFPTISEVIIQGNFYTVVEVEEDYFAIFDEHNHYRMFSMIEYNTMFNNYTKELQDLVQILKTAITLKNDLPIEHFGYLIKRLKSLNIVERDIQGVPNKLIESININGRIISGKTTASDVLQILKEYNDFK